MVGFRSISEGLTSSAAPLSFSRGHDAASIIKAGLPAGDHCLTLDYLRPYSLFDHPPALHHFISAINRWNFCENVRNTSAVHDLEVLQIFQIGLLPISHFSYKVERFLLVLNLHFFSAQKKSKIKRIATLAYTYLWLYKLFRKAYYFYILNEKRI